MKYAQLGMSAGIGSPTFRLFLFFQLLDRPEVARFVCPWLVCLVPFSTIQSTYCSAIQNHCKTIGRTVFVVNLDPAAEQFGYDCSVGPITGPIGLFRGFFSDVRELISVDDVLEEEQLVLGPNGALVYCMEYLAENLEWLHAQLNEAEDDYFLFDCPGQCTIRHLSSIENVPVQARSSCTVI